MKTDSALLAKNETSVVIKDKNIRLNGILGLPSHPKGLIIFAHGSGSSRFSPRNRFVSQELIKNGFATLLLDLLSDDEESDRGNVFNIDLLARRLLIAKNWAHSTPSLSNLQIGYFGASTGAGAALVAAALDPSSVFAVVSRGGRPDLAGPTLKKVLSPTLLIVGGLDSMVIDLNRDAFSQLQCEKQLEIVAGATHLFEESGTLASVSHLATNWFGKNLTILQRAEREGRSTTGI